MSTTIEEAVIDIQIVLCVDLLGLLVDSVLCLQVWNENRLYLGKLDPFDTFELSIDNNLRTRFRFL